MFAVKQTAIETFFKNGFTAVEIAFENSPTPSQDLFDEYVRFVVQFGDSRRMQIGGKGYRHAGIVMVQIMTKEGIGVSRGVALADIVKDLFLDVVQDGVNFQVPTVIKQPFSEKGWFQVQVTIPFYFDEVI